jgi:hypothetical protein
MNFWDSEETVGEVMKGEHTKIVLKRCTRNGRKYLVMWDHYNSENNPEWKWGKNGITICLEDPSVLVNLVNIIRETCEDVMVAGS